MPPDRPLASTSLPHLDIMLTDDGSRTLRDRHLNETFHSGCGALSECWHVYLLNSGVHELLAAQNAISNRSPVRVLELGFGTGMGWLITAAAAQVCDAALEYVSLESQLLPADVLAQIDTASAVARGIIDGWIPAAFDAMNTIERDWLEHRRTIDNEKSFTHQVSPSNRLQLIWGDARDWLKSLDCEPFDAIYFDAFSPATNPELWQEELFLSLKRSLKPSGKLVSYCVSGAVRRALQNAGYEIERKPGPPGGKREVLVCSLRP